ncbi:MAG: flagellar type III secretion system pore protein FliP [Myxococcota bacterium]|nr:flagellar type III secretion system pore protein FliP [Myxococcota bacterium]
MKSPRHSVRAAWVSFALALGVCGATLAPAFVAPAIASAQSQDDATVTPPGSVTVTLPDLEEPDQMVPALKILVLMTVLSLAPAILISMTSFTRIVIVLSFVRQAVGTQNVPPMQVILSLSLLLTAVVMAPIFHRVQVEALDPYEAEQIDGDEAWERGSDIMRGFLIRQTREDDLLLFYELSQTDRPADLSDVSLHLLVPAFMISELRTGFEMGFLLFLPFVLVDLITGSVLTSMGMVMLPPTMVSTPLKILLFVLVDGWALLTRSLVASFA